MAGFHFGHVPEFGDRLFLVYLHIAKYWLLMNNNKKILLWGTVAVVVLVAAVALLFMNLSSGKDREEFVLSNSGISVYHGIPSDAVAVLDFKHLEDYRFLLNDTLSPLYNLLDGRSGLVGLQGRLMQHEGMSQLPFVYSLHYSAKNSVSFLQVMDMDGISGEDVDLLFKGSEPQRKYNGAVIYSFPDGLSVTSHKGLLMASSSSYVLESSIRHLENSSSILDNREFEELLRDNGSLSGVYINHNQIGKLFSGVVERDFLGFSDFFMKFTSWSCFSITAESGRLALEGSLENGKDESRFSNILASQKAARSRMGEILPSSAVFAVSVPVSDMRGYLKAHRLYLEMQKKSGTFAYMQKVAMGKSKVEPARWVDSLAIEELVSAYCKFGEKCEWITAIRGKQQFGLNNMISAVVDKGQENVPEPFAYKGYLASVFGKLFSWCSEEYSCTIGPWTILGPKKILDDFANGSARYFTLEDFLSQTPASGYLSREASVKLVANLKGGGDSVLQVFKPYGRECLKRQLDSNNFEYLTADFLAEGAGIAAGINLYAATLAELPKPKERGDAVQMNFEIDSTINLPQGPFKVRDVAKKADAYLEQLPNMRLRYMDANKKGVWAIPFNTPICGYVEQIDLYGNGRLQMLFASEDKLYLLDRLGRFVYGYPAKLPKGVVMGPELHKGVKGEKYSVMVLNDDNTISWYDVSGKPMPGWSDITAPEFVKELPKLKELGGVWYWVLKAPSQQLLYTIDGKRVEMQDKKKKIDREQEIVFEGNGTLRIKCTDGKEYAWNLATGKTKKI